MLRLVRRVESRKRRKSYYRKLINELQAIGLDTAGWEDKAPEALEEIVENAEILHEIKMPEEPKAEGGAYKANRLVVG